MPEFGALEVLLAISRTGSLGAAGRELGLSQQAVTSRLSSLESLTGLRLVTRGARGSTLTSTGSMVAEWAEQLLGVAERLDAGIAMLRQESHRRLKVAASLTIAEQLLPRWLVSIRDDAKQHGTRPPDIVLVTTNSDHVIRAVREGEADLGFIEGPDAPKGLRNRVIAHDELVVIVPLSHKWARRSRPLSPDELRLAPLVSREPGSGTRESLSAALQRGLGAAAEQAPPAIELSSTTAIRAAVLAGAGPAVVSRLSVADDLTLNRLRVIPIAGLDLRRELRAIWLGGPTPSPGAARDLLNHITRQRMIARI
jgi:molybdate transport repressor ModE-like protein